MRDEESPCSQPNAVLICIDAMAFYADLHLHSKFSRATSRDSDLEHLAFWAKRKGVAVIGTGDFTHPAWLAEIEEKLIPAESGLLRLRDDLEREINRWPGAVPGEATRFMLEVEISTIYKKSEKTRKVHHLVYAPDLEKAKRIRTALAKIGNLDSDGRPILGLDSRDLLEITLQSGDGCYLVPAHIWTPWFSALGSKSGFDAVEECYADLAPHIFAVETGLSSDPPMNWRVSSLDRYTLVSNSDAHSPWRIGREACVFDCAMDYFSMRNALERHSEFAGTVEFFAEEGKYHMDGHRKCGVILAPAQTCSRDGICPVCGKALTVGVMHRVEELADRREGVLPPEPTAYRLLIPLPEVIAEIEGVGPSTKRVKQLYDQLIATCGSELFVLDEMPVEELRRAGSPILAEAVLRMRDGRVTCRAGFDGEYGVIRLFDDSERSALESGGFLFDWQAEPRPDTPGDETTALRTDGRPDEMGGDLAREAGASPNLFDESWNSQALSGLDPEQRDAAESDDGNLLISAGPGSGKTRTLTHRIASMIASQGLTEESCLGITFSRQAADEMRKRLKRLLGARAQNILITTFHGLGYRILREQGERMWLPKDLRVAGVDEQIAIATDVLNLSRAKARAWLRQRSLERCRGVESAGPAAEQWVVFEGALRERGLVDFEDLITLSLQLVSDDSEVQRHYHRRFRSICVDEFQDIDRQQYLLLRNLAPSDGTVFAIGDPDQSIYGFRGGDASLFGQFERDFAPCRTIQLKRNYRSMCTILDASLQVVAPASLVAERDIQALRVDAGKIVVHESPSESAEAEFVVHSIARMIEGQAFFSMDSGHVDNAEVDDLSFADFAVLYRSDAQSQALEQALARSGMPYQKRSHGRLIDQPFAQVVLEIVRKRERECSLQECIEQSAHEWKTVSGSAEFDRVMAVLTNLAAECRDAASFLSHLALGVDMDLMDPRAERVSLLTLHAAKGLEFRVVFIVGCEDGILPLHSGSDEADLAEERRLMFVGMSRARERLILSRAKRRAWRGTLREMRPSPYLGQIESALITLSRSDPVKQPVRPKHEQLTLF